ncbi:MAG TPA: 50S ribosomal protein L13 [Candidatus Wallbacteria bacterium]|nr:50S ribosomal protein L13 [Candidatus Wallbacteria bacterium]
MATHATKASEIKKEWVLVDAKDMILGRVASQVAQILRGKHKPSFVPYLDMGDNVIIINAEKITVSGKKPIDKIYYRHSSYPQGFKSENFVELQRRHPEELLRRAIWGMLPKGPLGRDLMRNVRIFKGENHTHAAQKPNAIKLEA